MSAKYLLAVDIGTQSNRAALVDLSGKVVAISSIQLDMISPVPGWAEQDARGWWTNTVANIRNLLAHEDVSGTDILGVAACGQMHAAIPLNRQGEVLLPRVQLWCDKRSAGLIDDYAPRLNTSEALKQVGNMPTPAWWGWKIKWVQTHQPDIFQATWQFLTAPAYIAYQLTGETAIDESEASGAYLMAVETGDWSPEMLTRMEIPLEKLPPVRPSGLCIGSVTPEAARATGLIAGTPVAAGAGDMLAALLAAGLTRAGQAVDITGTSGIINVFSQEPIFDPRLMNLHHCLPGWIVFGITDSGGGSLKWFRNAVCQEEMENEKITGVSAYQILDQKAAGVEPGCEGLLFFPYLQGERTLGSPLSKGVFFGLTPRSGKGAMARAIMEGVVFELRRSLEIIEASGMQVNQVRAVGGGGQSEFWCQIRADIYQKPVVMLKTFEGGVLGSAILAGMAAGIFSDLSSAADQFVHVDRILQPNRSLSSRYDRMFEVYKDLHDRMLSPFETMARLG